MIFTRRSLRQLRSLYAFIAERASDATAERYVDSIYDHCMAFDLFPNRGSRRDDLRRNLRIVGFRRSVTIAFTVDEDAVRIVGIFYGGQDIGAAFDSPDTD